MREKFVNLLEALLWYLWSRKSTWLTIRLSRNDQHCSAKISYFAILVYLRHRKRNWLCFGRYSGITLWTVKWAGHPRLILLESSCATCTPQTSEVYSSIRHMFYIFKVYNAVTKLDNTSASLDARRRWTNHCWPCASAGEWLRWWYGFRAGHAYIQDSSGIRRTELLVMLTWYFVEIERSRIVCTSVFSSVVYLRCIKFACRRY